MARKIKVGDRVHTWVYVNAVRHLGTGTIIKKSCDRGFEVELDQTFGCPLKTVWRSEFFELGRMWRITVLDRIVEATL